MQLSPLMSLQEECTQGRVAGQGALIGAATDRQIQAHPLGARRRVIYDDLLGTTPLETMRNTHCPPLVTGSSRMNRRRSCQAEP